MDITAVASVQQLREWVQDARQRTFELVGDLTDEQLMGPQLSVVNPGLWEMGHHAWFQSVWTLRHAGGQPPVLEDEDALYDSMAVAHDNRWDLPLPNREETLAYMREVQRLVLALLDDEPSDELLYHALYSTLHEDMHTEAITHTRQTHGYPEPRLTIAPADDLDTADGGTLTGDAEVPGGTFMLGSTADEPFVFDNEKWAHRVELQPFRIARVAVTQGEYATFIDDGGYAKQQLWSDAGWKWRCEAGADSHVYFSKDSSGAWQRRPLRSMGRARASPGRDPREPVRSRGLLQLGEQTAAPPRRSGRRRRWPMSPGGTLGERVGTFPWG